jgi:hypothetical protein
MHYWPSLSVDIRQKRSPQNRGSPMNESCPKDDPQPQRPREPEPWECCQSGCSPCVYDGYWEAVDHYEAALEAWKKRQSVRNRTA